MLADQTPMYIVDATSPLPGSDSPPNHHPEYYACRIPGAKFFDIDALSDPNTNLPHMMPDQPTFIQGMKKLQIKTDGLPIVVYDQHGYFSAPRAWFMFKVFGRDNVHVLDGGLKSWLAESGPTESGEIPMYVDENQENDTDYQYIKQPKWVATLEEALQIPEDIIDARPTGRFDGTQPEPRPIRNGHIPGSKSLFIGKLVNEDKTLKSVEEMRSEFANIDVDLDNMEKNIVFSCGSGMVACAQIFTAELCGRKDNYQLFDGSWTEYATKYPNPE